MFTNFKSDLQTRVDRAIDRKAAREKQWRECCRAVDARDRRTCRCCGKRTNPDDMGLMRGHRHHLVYRSAGGADSTANVVSLCADCHNDEHKHRLDIGVINRDVGADGPLEFWRKNDEGDWFLSRRELEIGRPERD